MSSDPAKYAHPERERRFLLSELPAGATDPREIVDERFTGGRLAGTDRAALRELLEAASTQRPERLE